MEIVPVIHVVDEKQVFTNIETCIGCGVKKVFLINHHESQRSLQSYSEEIRKSYGLWVGINLLGEKTVRLLVKPELFSLNECTDALWSDDGLTRLSWDVLENVDVSKMYKGQFFGGLAFKYQPQPSDLKDACEKSKFITSVSTTSGSATGQAPTRTKIQELRNYLGEHPMAIASGVSADNIKSFSDLVQYALVATSITGPNELIVSNKLNELIKLRNEKGIRDSF